MQANGESDSLDERAGWLRIRVVDEAKADHPAVNIKLPVGVAKVGLQMAKALSAQAKGVDVDWDSVASMLAEGEVGKIVEVEDEAQHKTVEVWVE